MVPVSSLQFRWTRLSLFLISPPSFSFRSLRCRCRARPRTHVRRTHAEERKRSHLPLPAVSLFSANVAKCLHFCITATIKPPSSLPLSWTSPSPALCFFLPSSFYLYETGLCVEEKTFFSFILCSSFPPFLIFITTQAPSSAPLSSLYSKWIPSCPLSVSVILF